MTVTNLSRAAICSIGIYKSVGMAELVKERISGIMLHESEGSGSTPGPGAISQADHFLSRVAKLVDLTVCKQWTLLLKAAK